MSQPGRKARLVAKPELTALEDRRLLTSNSPISSAFNSGQVNLASLKVARTAAPVIMVLANTTAARATAATSPVVSTAIKVQTTVSTVASPVIAQVSSSPTNHFKIPSGLSRFVVQPSGLPASTINLLGGSTGVPTLSINAEHLTATLATKLK